MSVRILQGDCREALAGMDADSVHACVTDPPYHLTANKKGGSGAASVDLATPYGRTRITVGNGPGGFMGMAWDSGDIAFRPETWAAVLRVLKPGGHLLAFGGTRTYHRMACAIEDAGFEIRDTIAWLYGSGFPKSHDVSKGIDRAAGAEREVIGAAPYKRGRATQSYSDTRRVSYDYPPQPITAPSTDASRQWSGWGTALKPAMEPIVVARKPLIGTVAANVLEHGTGAINVDGCRVKFASGTDREKAHDNALGPVERFKTSKPIYEGGKQNAGFQDTHSPLGRWPANVCHDGSDEVLAQFPDEAGAMAPVHRRSGDKFRNTYGAFAGDIDEQGSTFRGDAGSAARFFYCAKTSRAERDDGLEGDEKKPLLWSSGEQSPGTFQSVGTDRSARNNHPTVKPTDLMRWLVRLVTPPGGIVLDPFMGSGSTGRAAVLEHFGFLGIEIDPGYFAIAQKRIEATRKQPDLFAHESCVPPSKAP